METKIVTVSEPQVAELIAIHLGGMRENSPEGHVFALDDAGLSDANITLFGTWDVGRLLGIGALNRMSGDLGEIKSMRVRKAALGQGVGQLLLETIIEAARDSGMTRLSLETGSGESFDAAIGLYKKRGFQSGDAFGDYVASDFNQFFHLDL